MDLRDLHVGMKVDVIDTADIYCPATIISLKKDSATVRYTGWGKKYDEIRTFDMIRPAFSKVRRTRGWVKLIENLPHWPCIVYIRCAMEGSALGMKNLELEQKVFVEPFGTFTHRLLKPFAYGVWQDVQLVSPFSEDTANRKDTGFEAEPSSIKTCFERALEKMELFLNEQDVEDLDFESRRGSSFTWRNSDTNSINHLKPLSRSNLEPCSPSSSYMLTTSSLSSSSPLPRSPHTIDKEVAQSSQPFSVGDVVFVASRTWPGINKPGGVGRIRQVINIPLGDSLDSTPGVFYAVSYVLGGKESNVDPEYVTSYSSGPQQVEDNDSAKRFRRSKPSENSSSSIPSSRDIRSSESYTEENAKFKKSLKMPSNNKQSRGENRPDLVKSAASRGIGKESHSEQDKSTHTEMKRVLPPQPNAQWVQCDKCMRWRRLPPDASIPAENEKWSCHMNSFDSRFNSCVKPEEDYSEHVTVDNTLPSNIANEDGSKRNQKKRKGAMQDEALNKKKNESSIPESRDVLGLCNFYSMLTPVVSRPHGEVYTTLLASITPRQSTASLSDVWRSQSYQFEERSVNAKDTGMNQIDNKPFFSPQFSSRLIHSLGMGNDQVILSELRLMLKSGLAPLPQFLDDFLSYAMSLLTKCSDQQGDTNELCQQRLAVCAMLDTLNEYPSVRESNFTSCWKLHSWTPCFSILDRLLAELLLHTNRRYQLLTSTIDPLNDSGKVNSYSSSDHQSYDSVPFLLMIFRFVGRHALSKPKAGRVTVELPVPQVNELDLGSSEIGCYDNMKKLYPKLCHSSFASTSAGKDLDNFGWLQLGAAHMILTQLQKESTHQIFTKSESGRVVFHEKENILDVVPPATLHSGMAPLRDVSVNIRNDSGIASKTKWKDGQKQVEFSHSTKISKKKVVPLTVSFNRREVYETSVLKPFGLKNLAVTIRKSLGCNGFETSMNYDGVRHHVQRAFTESARFHQGMSDNSCTSDHLQVVRGMHCHLAHFDDILEELLLLYILM